jgi:hypothetical protein
VAANGREEHANSLQRRGQRTYRRKRIAVDSGGPLYQYIEFCRKPETLWGKLQEGRWDWLGVHPKGQFVLGRPSRARVGLQVSPIGVVKTDPGAIEGHNGVKVYRWLGWPNSPAGALWFTSAEEARTEFEREVERLHSTEQSPVLARVVLIELGQATDERFIAQTPTPNYQ